MRRLLAAALMLAAVGGCASTTTIEIQMRYSRFEPVQITVPAGVPVTFVLRNEDPIDHEWIVGDAELHEIHRVGTHLHGDLPTEVFVPALESRRTTVTFDEAGQLRFVCHLPQHEVYGMTGVVTVMP
ncbi:MAG TPA: cupredoxin domain-containing protein [Candidatus Limnocylindria bacterium]|nr:cupredoxin domain-containing protein [Candidatus Limnocylindria bacterium]